MLKRLFVSMRPEQWIKNVFVFATLLFSKNLFHLARFSRVFLGFGLFCLVASSVYLINDVFDIGSDRKHPVKSRRPLPSGELKVRTAVLAAVVIGLIALAIAFFLRLEFGIVVLIYFVMNLAYSVYLKRIVIIDVLAIAAGFVLRVIAGSVVIALWPSAWLIICTVLLSLFLALGKRRHELVLLNEVSNDHRNVLMHYSPYLLDQMTSIVTASTMMSYILYTISRGTSGLIYSAPFVLYGIFRYLYLIHQKEGGGSPTMTLLTDKPLIINAILWVAYVIFVLHYWEAAL